MFPAEPLEHPLGGERRETSRSRLAWRLNRLRCMSAAEVGHRLRRHLAMQAERLGLYGTAVVPEAEPGQTPSAWVAVPDGIDPAPYLAAADQVMAGRFDVLALHDIELGSPPRWNRDPKSGITAPSTFGKLLDYRNPALVGDIKYLWEPNRHLHLVTLAQAWALSGNARYFQTLVRHLESWFDDCPCGQGPNWSSALEAGLRLINWSVSWQLLGGLHSPLFRDAGALAFRRRWLEAIHQHARFIGNYFSRHSSANNHLIGEASGLFVAALTWPYWPESARWRATAQAILEREAVLQNAADGVNREQTTAYQQFELELLLLPLFAGEANGAAFSADYRAIIEKMLEYLASIMDVGGNVPMFGDADDGVVLRLDPAAVPDRSCHSLLATGALLFGRGDFKHKAGELDERNRWLFGAGAAERFAALLPPSGPARPIRQAFPHGGYYILGCDFETPDEIRLIADAGPLGYQRIAAHGHADALSFTLSVGGREFLIDPGTYAYHTQAPWRQYFRGTSAHNTARVDGLDQSQPGGNFMWLRKATAHCSDWRSSPDLDVFEGWHDGYRHLADPVVHQRRIVLDKIARRICIEDHFRMKGEHRIELFFHCGEHCRVDPAADGYLLSHGDKRLHLSLPEVGHATQALYRGNLTPIAGWVSRHFDDKQLTTSLKWAARLRGDSCLRTVIQAPPRDAEAPPEAAAMRPGRCGPAIFSGEVRHGV